MKNCDGCDEPEGCRHAELSSVAVGMRSEACANIEEGARNGCGYKADTCDGPDVSGISDGSPVPTTRELANGTGEPCLLSISSRDNGSLMTYRSCFVLGISSANVHVHTLVVKQARLV